MLYGPDWVKWTQSRPKESAARRPLVRMLNSLDLEGAPQDTRVVVAMSGGRASSVAAARALGAEALATGPYGASRRLPTGERALFRAREEERDQSYFLFATTREQIDFLRFPLGDLAKSQTRELARRFALPVAEKPDSQDICFVPTGRYADMIERLRPGAAAAGDIVDLSGRVLGPHGGIINFPVGQGRRRGIGGGEPLYVVRLDAA